MEPRAFGRNSRVVIVPHTCPGCPTERSSPTATVVNSPPLTQNTVRPVISADRQKLRHLWDEEAARRSCFTASHWKAGFFPAEAGCMAQWEKVGDLTRQLVNLISFNENFVLIPSWTEDRFDHAVWQWICPEQFAVDQLDQPPGEFLS